MQGMWDPKVLPLQCRIWPSVFLVPIAALADGPSNSSGSWWRLLEACSLLCCEAGACRNLYIAGVQAHWVILLLSPFRKDSVIDAHLRTVGRCAFWSPWYQIRLKMSHSCGWCSAMKRIYPQAAWYLCIMLAFNSGMFSAATSFLPSTFAMYALMAASVGVVTRNVKVLKITCLASGRLISVLDCILRLILWVGKWI